MLQVTAKPLPPRLSQNIVRWSRNPKVKSVRAIPYLAGSLVALAMCVAVGAVALTIVDTSSEAEPSWIERQIAPALLRMKLRLSRPMKTSPLTPTEVDLERGGEIYQQQCAYCHGATRGRMAPFAQSFSPRPPQFVIVPSRGPTWMDAYFIQHGVRWSGMPAFRRFTASDAWRLALYVEGRNTPTEQ